MNYKNSILMLGLFIALGACQEVNHTSSNELTEENFTAKGKPTKTLSTPRGDQEVYDPTQDPEIRKLFRGIYDYNRDPNNIDISYDYRSSGSIFFKVRQIQQLDLYRAGCKFLVVPHCGIESPPPERTPLCRKLSWGSDDFSRCEIKGWTKPEDIPPLILREEIPNGPCISDSKGNPVPVARVEEIGPKSTKMPYEDFEDQLDGFFKAECSAYFE
ncbi:MAG: hypothetical protein ABJG88_13450 [Litorimonas sp.]